MIRGTIRFAVEAASALFLASCLILGLLAWRLAEGPIRIDSLTPVLEDALAEAGLRIAIEETALSWGSGERVFDLRARRVRLFDAEGVLVASVPEIGLGFDVGRLARGELTPTRIDLIRPGLHAIRAEDGTFRFDLLGPQEPSKGERADIVGDLLEALQRAPGSGSGPLAELRSVGIREARLVLEDRAGGQTWHVPRLDLQLRRDDRGIHGAAGLDVTLGDGIARISASLRHAPNGSTDIDAQVEGLRPAALAARVPELAVLGAAATTLGGTVHARLDAGFALRAIRVDLTGAGGTLRLPDRFPEPLPITYVTLRARLDAAARTAHIEELFANLGGPKLSVSGNLADRDGRLDVRAEAEVQGVAVDDLDRLWPAGLAEGARSWVTENLYKGQVDVARATAVLDVPLAEPERAELRALDGAIHFRGVDVTYFGSLPPVTGVDGVARFDAARFDLDLAGGKLRNLQVGRSRIAITGLDGGEPAIDIAVPISGPLRTVLEVLNRPPLEYPAKLGLDPANASGRVDGTASFKFPLVATLALDDVVFGAEAKLKDAAVEGIVAGMPVGRGMLSLSLDPAKLVVKGTADVNGIPATVSWQENFSPNAAESSRMTAKAVLQEGDLRRLGYDLEPWLKGPVAADLAYVVPKPGTGRLTADLDLSPSTLAVEPLDWSKPAGRDGRARFELLFDHGRPAHVPFLEVVASGLSLRGRLDLDAAGTVSGGRFDEIVIGLTQLRGEAQRNPAGVWQVSLEGPSFDLTPLLDDSGEGEEAAHDRPDEGAGIGVPVELSLRLERVLLGEKRWLEAVGGKLSHDSNRWTQAQIDGLVGGTAPISLRYWPEAEQFRLRVETLDAGSVLGALHIIENIRGGRLLLDGTMPANDPEAPLSGRVEMTEFTVVRAPALARLLNAVSPTGLAELLGGKGIGFERLEGKWRWREDRIEVSDLRTAGAALGLTAQGVLDLDRDVLDIEGTIVPVFGINRILGEIPLLGQILTGGKGQGVFAFTYKLKGPTDDPTVTVNPLSVLTPGFLRTIFFLGPGPDDKLSGTEDGLGSVAAQP